MMACMLALRCNEVLCPLCDPELQHGFAQLSMQRMSSSVSAPDMHPAWCPMQKWGRTYDVCLRKFNNKIYLQASGFPGRRQSGLHAKPTLPSVQNVSLGTQHGMSGMLTTAQLISCNVLHVSAAMLPFSS